MIALKISDLIRREATVFDVPAEGSQLHNEDHLYACDVDGARIVDELAIDMVDRHVTHEEDEADPWHEGAIDVTGNGICPNRADEDCANAGPEIK